MASQQFVNTTTLCLGLQTFIEFGTFVSACTEAGGAQPAWLCIAFKKQISIVWY